MNNNNNAEQLQGNQPAPKEQISPIMQRYLDDKKAKDKKQIKTDLLNRLLNENK